MLHRLVCAALALFFLIPPAARADMLLLGVGGAPGGNAPVVCTTTVADRANSTGVTYATRTNTTLTAPSGIQNGDVLFIFFSIGSTGTVPTPTAPSGFSLVPGPSWPISNTDITGFTVHDYAWYKIASSESGNYTITHSSATSQGWIADFSGGNNGNPFLPNATSATGTGTTTTATGLTTPQNGSEVVFVSQDWGDTTNNLTGPTGSTPTFTKRFGESTTSGVDYAADGNLATVGATGNKSITNNNMGSNPWAGFLFSVQPACSGYDTTRNSGGNNVFSSGNTIVTDTGTGNQDAYLTTSHASGKWVVSFAVKGSGTPHSLGVGFGNSSAGTGSGSNMGFDGTTNDFAFYGDGTTSGCNGTSIAATGVTFAVGDQIDEALDMGGKLYWIRSTSVPNWNNSGAANPATGTGGISLSSIACPITNVFPGTHQNAGTPNDGMQVVTPPTISGFSPWQ